MDPLSPARMNAGWSSSPSSSTSQAQQSPSYASSSHVTSPLPTSSSISSFKEPKVFGAPPQTLVSPPGTANGEALGSAAAQDGGRPQGPVLRVRISGLERNRKDILIRFDASTNLPQYRQTIYRNVQRSYLEFQRFAEQLSYTCPHTIVSALPLASTSAMTDAEDDRLVRISLQRWFSRVCEDLAIQQDDELMAFIESDFSYNPTLPASARRPASATSSATNVFTAALSKVVRRGPTDEDEELASAKVALERLETNWGNAAVSVSSMGKARRAHAMSMTDVASKMVSLSTVESDMQLASAVRKIGRGYEQLANLDGNQAVSENVVMSDSLGYQALNAKAAKDALLHRTQTLEDAQSATKAAINKRRNVERLRGSSNIHPIKVDEAINDMEEANNLESQMAAKLNAISRNLHVALRAHSRHTHEDVALALLENARLTIGFHKHSLRELEALRPDLLRIGAPASAANLNKVTQSPTQQRPQVPITPSGPNTMGQPRPNTPQQYQQQQHQQQQQQPQLQGPPRMATSQSMFLPQPQPPMQRPTSAGPPPQKTNASNQDPLGGGMAQSMMLPTQAQAGRGGRQTQTLGRAGGRRLDERQAAKMLAGGF